MGQSSYATDRGPYGEMLVPYDSPDYQPPRSYDPNTINPQGQAADQAKRNEKRKALAKLATLESQRNAFNAQRASTILSAMGQDFLNQSIQGGALTQPILSRGTLG